MEMVARCDDSGMSSSRLTQSVKPCLGYLPCSRGTQGYYPHCLSASQRSHASPTATGSEVLTQSFESSSYSTFQPSLRAQDATISYLHARKLMISFVFRT